jgi:PAS domain S-box-containing protein
VDTQDESPGQQRHPAPPAAGNPSLLLAAIEAVGEAVVITSPDLDPPGPYVEYVNPAFSQMTGYEAEEIIGQTPRILQGPLTEHSELTRMRSELTQYGTFQGETVNYRKDGTKYVVEWLITPLRDPDGRVAHWISVQRDVTTRRQAEEHQQLLINELNHRVKNTLATVQSVTAQTLRNAASPQQASLAIESRLIALSRAHDVLTRQNWEGAELRDLAAQALEPYGSRNEDRLHLGGPTVWLPPQAALALAMAFHELATNAVKYGALSNATGEIRLTWAIDQTDGGSILRVCWQELGGPPVAPPSQRGFGTRLIERSLADDLGGEIKIDFASTGIVCEARIALIGSLP